MTKKKTIRYFTNTDKYMGWEYYNPKKIAEYTSWRKSGNYLKMEGKTYGATIILQFVGIDDWNRPVFKNVNNNIFYGSTNLLFEYGASENEVLSKIQPIDICYFGHEFNCEPNGGNPAYPIEFVRSEVL